jgi:hypothetical protein
MKICLDCRHVFSEDEIAYWREQRGEYWGMPCYETVCGCPICHGEFDDAIECVNCGEYFAEYELNDGDICDECAEELEE